MQGLVEHFPAWPNPFTCGIKKQTTWQCGQYVVIDVELVAGCLAHFFFSNFVPSFNEITRKFVGGSYKCGFYGTKGARSPVDVFWKGQNAGQIAGEILSPVARGLFYWWAAETAFDAVSLWESLIYAEDAGKATPNSALLPEAHGDIRFDSSFGALIFPSAKCIFDLHHQAATAFVEADQTGPWSSKMYGVVSATGSDHINLHGELRVTPGNITVAEFDLEDVRFGQVVPWSMEVSNSVSGLGLQNFFSWTQDVISPLFPSEVIANRWLVKQEVN